MFQKAKPIFLKGRSTQQNVLAGFRQDFVLEAPAEVTMRIAGRSFYRLYINGAFASFGPARAQHGYLRVDTVCITPWVKPGVNTVAIEVLGYNATTNNFITYEPSVLVAEVTSGDSVLCATDADWKGIYLTQKAANTEPLGFGRRVPMELYTLDAAFYDWRTGEVEEPCEEVAGGTYLPRGVALPDLSLLDNPALLGVYSRTEDEAAAVRPVREWWEQEHPADTVRFFAQNAKERDTRFDGQIKRSGKTISLSGYTAPAALDFDLGEAEVGHVGLVFSTDAPVTVDVIYNDILDRGGHIPAFSDSIRRVIRLQAGPGRHAFESFEFEFAKYIKVIVRGGANFTLESVYLRKNRFPDLQGGAFLCSDAAFNRVYEGAKRTLLTNTLEFFMDCPGRERSGWSGDSYWTGRAMRMLNGDNTVEKAMLENFLMSNTFSNLDGTFASCCCAGPEEPEGLLFSWNLFILYELADYCKRTADTDLAERYRSRVEAFLKTVERYTNAAGFIENPPGATFIDWSGANDGSSVLPVSLPTNIFFAVILQELSDLYGVEAYKKQSLQIMDRAYRLLEEQNDRYAPFTRWPYMPDSLVCEDGKLRSNGGWSEAAQYYLFWLGYLNKDNAPDLLEYLTESFGPCPTKYRGTGHLAVKPSGFFFGYMVRFEMLSRTGQYEVLAKELKDFCGYLLDNGPGTYWETLNGEDSLNHGFGSHIGVVLMRDFLGLGIPNEMEKTIAVAPHPCHLEWARGCTTVEDSVVSVQWEQRPRRTVLTVSAPADYALEVTLPDTWLHHSRMRVNGVVQPVRKDLYLQGSVEIELI